MVDEQIYLDFVAADGGLLDQDHDVEWDWDLDTRLVHEGVTARTIDEEEERMSLRLRYKIWPLQRKVSDGYFNALIVHVIEQGPYAEHARIRRLFAKQGPYAEYAKIRRLFANIHEYQPYESGQLDEDIAEVQRVFTEIDHEITVNLKYDDEVAENIFVGALVMYLDERFHVTERLQMFGY